VIRPEPQELQELVRDLHRQGRPWLPAGLGSRLHWGPPVAACEVVSTAALRGIHEHNPGDFTLTVAAGTPLEEIQETLARHGQWLALDTPFQDRAPAAGASSAQGGGNIASAQGGGSIGGLVARGLAGGYRERYLGVRDQLIGLRLLRADGVAARAGGRVVKHVAGHDQLRLLRGSWGSLALITELTLRTMPLPGARGGVVLAGALPALLRLRSRLLASGLTPERLDLWHAPLAAAAGLAPEPLLLVALASVNQASLEAQQQAVLALAEAVDGAGEPSGPGAGAAAPAALRTHCCDADELAALLEHSQRSSSEPDWLLRLAVLPSRIGELLPREELAGVYLSFGAGSGVGLAWSGAATAAEAAPPLTAARVRQLRHQCRELGGHLTVLRQPPPPPAEAPAPEPLPAWEDAPSRPLIEAIKAQFDPKGQLAPGRLPGVAYAATR